MATEDDICGVVERIRESIRIEEDADIQEFARKLNVDVNFVQSALRKPVPLDLCNPQKVIIFRELMSPADPPVNGKRLYQRVWELLSLNSPNDAQDQRLLVLTGVSGVGKTKIAYDIGRNHAVVIIVRIWEARVFTAPFAMLSCRVQELMASFASGGCTLQTAQELAFTWLQHLLLSHLEWVLDVLEQFVKVEGYVSFPDLRNVAIRCQRNGVANREVKRRFERALNNTDIGVETRTNTLVSRSQTLLPDNSPLVWCHDEAQALFTEFPKVHELFERTFPNEWYSDDAGATAPQIEIAPEEDEHIPWLVQNNADDTSDCRPASQFTVFRAYLGVLRTWMSEGRNFSHMLTGTSLHLTEDMISKQSPARGVTQVVHVGTALGEDDVRAAYSEYLTTAALEQLPAEYFQRVRGRPLYCAQLWSAMLSTSTDTLEGIPDAARIAVSSARKDAVERTWALWRSGFQTSKGRQPHQLVLALYYLMRMGYGATSQIAKRSEEVFEAIRHGVLNVSFEHGVLNLDEEPITKEAILHCGDEELRGKDRDSIFQAIEDRWRGPFGDDSAKGGVFEDMFVWHVVRRCVTQPTGTLTLAELLQSFDFDPAFIPPTFEEYKVHISLGRHCSDASTCFLDAFCFDDPPEREEEAETKAGENTDDTTIQEMTPNKRGARQILHHLPHEMAGADVAFLVWRQQFVDTEEVTEWRLVIIQLKNKDSAGLPDALRSLDMGQWFPDRSLRSGAPKEETASHRIFRESIAKCRRWACEPIRLIVHQLRTSERLQCQIAYLNDQYYPRQPLLLVCFRTRDKDGDTTISRIQNSNCYRLSKIRHWNDDTHGDHPQAYLDDVRIRQFPSVSRLLSVKRRLLSLLNTQELLEEAKMFGACCLVRNYARGIVVEYKNVYHAMAAARAVSSVGFSFTER